MAKATAQARLAAGLRKGRAAKSDGINACRNNHVLCRILDQIGTGPDVREDAFARRRRSIQLAHGSMRNSHGWRQNDAHRLCQTSCPFLPQLNVIQCTDRIVAAS
jgi:hypothetical protein